MAFLEGVTKIREPDHDYVEPFGIGVGYNSVNSFFIPL